MKLEQLIKLFDSKGIWYSKSFTGKNICIKSEIKSENGEIYSIVYLFNDEEELFDIEIW